MVRPSDHAHAAGRARRGCFLLDIGGGGVDRNRPAVQRRNETSFKQLEARLVAIRKHESPQSVLWPARTLSARARMSSLVSLVLLLVHTQQLGGLLTKAAEFSIPWLVRVHPLLGL